MPLLHCANFHKCLAIRYYIEIPIEESTLSIRVASIGRGRNYCHALYSALHSVKLGECTGCRLLSKLSAAVSLLEHCLVYGSNLCCCIHSSFLEADAFLCRVCVWNVCACYIFIQTSHSAYCPSAPSCSWLLPL